MFSVIMPVWNRERLVGRAIESVLGQTYEDFELIVVDDGSTDRLEDVVRPFLADSRVRFLRIPHGGVSAARNAGIREAKRALIAYLDSDNEWRPRFLERMKETLGANDEERLVAYCLAQIHKGEHLPPEKRDSDVLGKPFDIREMLRENFIDQNTLVHARHCVDIVGPYDEQLKRLVDWDFLLRLVLRFEPLFIPEILVDYHLGTAENSIYLTEDLIKPMERVRRKLARYPQTVSFRHDMTGYSWTHVPEEKYYNWLRVNSTPYDTRTYAPFGLPYMLQVEPSSRCNLACPLCPVGRNELGRPRRDMTFDEFRGIVDDMERWLLFLVLWDWGEPFSNPQLPKMIRYAAERDIRTVTSTNAHFLGNDEYVAEILGAGLSTLIVAIDSLHAEGYVSYRRGGKLDRAVDGLRKVVALKRKLHANTVVNLRMVVMRYNEREVGGMRKLARDAGADQFTVKTLNPSCGDMSMDSELVPKSRRLRRFEYRKGTWERIRIEAPCDRVFTMSNIFSNGGVVPCCYDYDASMKIGNAFEERFSRIWLSPAYRDVRRRIHEARDSVPRCRNCHVNFKHSKTGWFAEALDLTVPIRPFHDLRQRLGM